MTWEELGQWLDATGNSLRWEMTPARIESPGTLEITSQEDWIAYTEKLKADAGRFLFLNVWDCRVKLAMMEASPLGNIQVEEIDDPPCSVEELEEALDYVGGYINQSGHYRLAGMLRDRLRDALGITSTPLESDPVAVFDPVKGTATRLEGLMLTFSQADGWECEATFDVPPEYQDGDVLASYLREAGFKTKRIRTKLPGADVWNEADDE